MFAEPPAEYKFGDPDASDDEEPDGCGAEELVALIQTMAIR